MLVNVYEFIYKCQQQILGKSRISIDIFADCIRLTAMWPRDNLVCQELLDLVDLQGSYAIEEHYRNNFVARCNAKYREKISRDLHTV